MNAAAVAADLAALREREAEMVALLADLVNHDTPSGHKALVDRAMAVVERTAASFGAQVERDPQPDAGDHLIARWGARGEDARHALVLAHLDTVWPAGEAERRPFTDTAGRLTGPGVFDMKAGVVQALFAIRAFAAGGATADARVTLVVSSDEETGSRTSRALIERLARTADVVFVVEPASGPALKTARKGVGMYRVEVEGVAAHAGLEPEKGRSAVLELAHQIIALHDLADPASGTTVTVGTIEGGSSRNVVPARAAASVDLRVVTEAAAEELDAALRALTPRTPGTTVTVTGGINRPPMERTAATGAWYDRAVAVAGALGEELGELLVGGGSDGNFTAALGIPTLDGLGAVGGGAHALTEHVIRAAMPVRSALLAGLLREVAGLGPRPA